MDVNNLRMGEKIAGASGIALLLIMFIFGWFSIDEISAGSDSAGALGEFAVSGDDLEDAGEDTSFNAWQSFGLIDLVLLVTLVAAIALAAVSVTQTNVNMPVALSAITAGLGILSVLLIVFRIIFTPDLVPGDLPDGLDVETDISRGIGVFLGLIAAAGVAYGGWTAMQDEGTSFTDQRDRVQRPDSGPGAPPPGPPPAGPTA